MPGNNYNPIPHDHDAFLKKASRRKGFAKAYDDLEGEYSLAYALLSARVHAGLTQEQVAECMGTTKSAISRLESPGKHSPSVSTLERYAEAVGCTITIQFVPSARHSMVSREPCGSYRSGRRRKSVPATRKR